MKYISRFRSKKCNILNANETVCFNKARRSKKIESQCVKVQI
jgi:hypothetical protein